MRVAVTGASGFIGSHVLADLARRANVDVVAIGRRGGADHLQAPALRTVVLDLAQAGPDVFDRLGRPDVLIHMAWGGLPNYRSLHHIEHELPLQYRFLSAMVRSGLSAIVATGTCFEYGMQDGALDEASATRPDNPYGFAKDTLRRQLQFLQAAHPFALTWGRLFYLRGTGQAANSLLPQLQSAVERGDTGFDMSGGEQLRDYLPVEDVACHLVTMALAKSDAGVVNICSGKPISVRRLVEEFLAERGSSIRLNLGHYAYPNYEPLAFWGRRERLDRVLREAGEGNA